MKRHSVLAMILVLALLAGAVAGCGKTVEEPQPVVTPEIVTDTPTVPVEGEEEEYEPLSGEYFYSLEYSNVLYDGSEDFHVLCYKDDGLYASIDDGSGARLCFINGANETNYVADYAPVTENGVPGSPVFLDIDSDGRLVIVENVEGYKENADETYTYYSAYYIRTLADDGTQFTSARLDDVNAVSMSGGAALLRSNTVVFASAGACTAYDYSAKKLFEKKIEGAGESGLVKLKDGRVGMYVADQNKIVILNALEEGQTEEYELPGQVYGGKLVTGAGYYDFCYTCGTDFYGYNLADRQADKLFNWINSGIVYDELQAVRLLEDGRASAVKYDWSYFYDSCTVNSVLINRIPAENDERVKLTIAAPYSGYSLWYNIIDFNAVNPDYKIELVDYSASGEAGNESLIRDIRGGYAADILYVDQFEEGELTELAATGAFEELYPYLQADPDLSAEDLVGPVLKACEFDGKLMYTAVDFSILSYAGLSATLGNEAKISIEDMHAARKKLVGANASVFPLNGDPFIVLNDYLSSVSDYVDFYSEEPQFDADAFATRLNVSSLAAVRPKTENNDDYARLTSGEQLLIRAEIENATELALIFNAVNRPLTFVGLPMEKGSGNLMNISRGYAISTGSSNKEGAWEFIRTFLMEEYQMENTWRLPVNLNALKASAEARIDSAYIQAEGSAVTRDYVYNAFMKLVESAERVATYDSEILEIAKESCGAFFQGADSDYGAAEKFGTAVLEYLNQ